MLTNLKNCSWIQKMMTNYKKKYYSWTKKCSWTKKVHGFEKHIHEFKIINFKKKMLVNPNNVQELFSFHENKKWMGIRFFLELKKLHEFNKCSQNQICSWIRIFFHELKMLLNKLRIFQKISKKSKNIFRIQTNVYTIFFGFIEIFVKKKKKLSKNVHEFKKGLEWKKIERKNCRKKRKTGVRTGPVHLDRSPTRSRTYIRAEAWKHPCPNEGEHAPAPDCVTP